MKLEKMFKNPRGLDKEGRKEGNLSQFNGWIRNHFSLPPPLFLREHLAASNRGKARLERGEKISIKESVLYILSRCNEEIPV